jgi:colanic acid biosynthesis glycosyl transferase WcaI
LAAGDCAADIVDPTAGPQTRRLVRSWLSRDRPLEAIAAALVLKVALDASYALIVPTTHYYALLGTHFSWAKLAESYPLVAIGLVVLPRDFRRLSTLVLWLLAILMLVPMGTIYAFQDQPRAFMYATVGFFVLTGILIRIMPDIRLPTPPDWFRRRSAAVLYGVLVVTAVTVMVVYTGTTLLSNITRLNIDLSGSYADRADFVAAALPLKGYYFHWLALVFNPVFVVWAVLTRRWWTIPLLLLFQFAIASEVGARSYFLDLPFVLAIALVAWFPNPPKIIALVGAAAVILSATAVVVLGSLLPFDFIAGRFLLVPSQLNFLYYDFFSTYGLIPGAYLFKFFLKIPYPLGYNLIYSPPNVIGGFYFHRTFNFAITGILGDSYMNLGFPGMALGALVVAITLKGIDAVSVGLDQRLATAAVVMPAVAITGTFFVRVLVTTGLLVMFLFLYALPRPARQAEPEGGRGARRGTTGTLKFLILTQYFPPEVGAAQTRLIHVARALLEAGHECRVVTAMPNYPSGRVADPYRGRWRAVEQIDSVPVVRSAILAVRAPDMRRLFSYLSFQLTSLPQLFSMARTYRPDYLFVESPPLSLGLSGIVFKRFVGIPYIFNVADLWPDWAVAIGAIRPGGFMHRIAAFLERAIYREADFVTVVVPGMEEALVAKGVSAAKILVLPNGVDVAEFAAASQHPSSRTAQAILVEAAGRPIALYAGTHGAYHGLEMVLDAASRPEVDRVFFAFVGDGSEKSRLVANAAARKLGNVGFFDPVPSGEVAELLAVSSVALSVIKIPTRAAKVMPAMAAGIPIVYAGRGDGADLINTAQAGIVVDPDRADELAAAIAALIGDRSRATRLGQNGRRYAERNLDWRLLVSAWVHTLEARTGRIAPTPQAVDRTKRVPMGGADQTV